MPALLVSISSGLIVTRVGRRQGPRLRRRSASSPARRRRSAAPASWSLLMALVPGLPEGPVPHRRPRPRVPRPVACSPKDVAADDASVAAVLAAEADARSRPRRRCSWRSTRASSRSSSTSPYDLIELVDGASGGDLLDRVRALRRKIAGELGIVMPAGPHPRRTSTCRARHVRRSACTASRSAAASRPPAGCSSSATTSTRYPGDDIIEPVFGLPARWVPIEFRAEAEIAGQHRRRPLRLVVDPPRRDRPPSRRQAARRAGREGAARLGQRAPTRPSSTTSPATGVGVGRGAARARSACSTSGCPIRDLVRILEVGRRACPGHQGARRPHRSRPPGARPGDHRRARRRRDRCRS